MQSSSRLLVAVALCFATGTAAAESPIDRGYRFDPPNGLTYNESLSAQVTQDLSRGHHYDGLETELGADAYVSKDGYAFYALWVRAIAPTDKAELLVRRTFDSLRQAPVDETGRIQSAEMVSWNEDVQSELAVGNLEWRHLSNETVTLVRSTMYLSKAKQLRQVRGECVMQADAVDRLRPKCATAFAALRLTDTDRGPLGAVPAAGSLRLSNAKEGDPMLLVVEDDSDVGAGGSPSSGSSLRPPTEGAVLYETRRQPTPKKDNNFLYIGGAILLIIAAYVLMRRPRDDEAVAENEDETRE